MTPLVVAVFTALVGDVVFDTVILLVVVVMGLSFCWTLSVPVLTAQVVKLVTSVASADTDVRHRSTNGLSPSAAVTDDEQLTRIGVEF